MDLHLQVVLLDCLPRPSTFHQLGFCHQHSVAIDQREQDVEGPAA